MTDQGRVENVAWLASVLFREVVFDVQAKHTVFQRRLANRKALAARNNFDPRAVRGVLANWRGLGQTPYR